MPLFPKQKFCLAIDNKIGWAQWRFPANDLLFCVVFLLYAKGQWLEDTLDAYFNINAEYKTYLFSELFSYILIWLFYIKKISCVILVIIEYKSKFLLHFCIFQNK